MKWYKICRYKYEGKVSWYVVVLSKKIGLEGNFAANREYNVDGYIHPDGELRVFCCSAGFFKTVTDAVAALNKYTKNGNLYIGRLEDLAEELFEI